MKFIELHEGELYLSNEPLTVRTITGSCVVLTLYCKKNEIGGIIHIALPKMQKLNADNPLRYADYAVPKMIKLMMENCNNNVAALETKLVGGAGSIGLQNVLEIKKILCEFNIKIKSEDIGGDKGREVRFLPHTGKLEIKTFDTKVLDVKSLETRKIKVLIVDDSKTIRSLLKRILESSQEFEVIGTAENADDAQKIVESNRPDVISLDLYMPGKTGLEWLESLLPRFKIPVIMISSLDYKEGNEIFRALELGAIDYIKKPSMQEIAQVTEVIQEKIKFASQAKVISHQKNRFVTFNNKLSTITCSKKLIAIGASTGGTEALRALLERLPKGLPPIVIVQHIPAFFSKAFAERLNQLCSFEVREAKDGDLLQSSLGLIAPGGLQMKLEETSKGLIVRVTDDPPVNRHKPSVDFLFKSIADLNIRNSLVVMLTGMGADGAKEMLRLKKIGARSIGQDEQSSVVYGMPKAAFDIGAIEKQCSLEEMPEILIKMLC